MRINFEKERGFIPLLVAFVVVLIAGSTFVAIKTGVLKLKNDNTSNPISFSVATPTPTPTPVPTGFLTGKLTGGYYSKPIANVKITATGSSNKEAVSDGNGAFIISDMNIGNYNLSFDSSDYKFSSFSVEIKEGENKLDKAVYGSLINPKPMILNAYCFIDSNKNSTKDSGEKPIDASASLFYYESNTWVLQKNLPCKTSGSFSETLTKIGKYRLEPGGYTFYAKPGVQDLVVDGYGSTKNINLGYIPLKVEGGFTVYVFNDKNENGSRDTDEENIHYQYVRITNLSGVITQPLGSSYNVAVSTSGEGFNQFETGTYKFELIPETSSWDVYYKITKRETTVVFDQNTPRQTIYLGAHKLY